MYNRKTFAMRLRELREEKNLSYAELAKNLGVSSVSLGYYEREERVPDIEVLNKMCCYFNVTSDYLIGLTNNRTVEAASVGEVTGLSDKAIAVLRYYNTCYKDSDNDNILPLINFLLASDMTSTHAYVMYNRLEQEKERDKETLSNVIYSPSGKVLLDKNIIDIYLKLCGKPLKGYPVLAEILKYFNTPVSDKEIYLTEKGELCDRNQLGEEKGRYGYGHKLSDLVEQALLSNIRKSLQALKEYWQEQNNNDVKPNERCDDNGECDETRE